jgi:hypothetical protein
VQLSARKADEVIHRAILMDEAMVEKSMKGPSIIILSLITVICLVALLKGANFLIDGVL